VAQRDNAASVQGVALRITPLNQDGSIKVGAPVLTTDGFITASFGPEFEDGDEITEKAANGKICVQYKADDSLKGVTFNLTLCSPDPEASALLAGGGLIFDAGGLVVGYSSPKVGDAVGNPVAIELWSKAILNGKPAAGTPYFHWAFPYVRVRYDGDREFTNGALANTFSGTGVGNDALACSGLTAASDDFGTSKYAAALVNPFSYIRTGALPVTGWSTTAAQGAADFKEGDLCAANAAGPVAATGATAGAPGAFTPAGAAVPANLAALAAVIANPNTAWATGENVVLGDASTAHWDGTAWAAGNAP
jgi:hypothetical protein